MNHHTFFCALLRFAHCRAPPGPSFSRWVIAALCSPRVHAPVTIIECWWVGVLAMEPMIPFLSLPVGISLFFSLFFFLSLRLLLRLAGSFFPPYPTNPSAISLRESATLVPSRPLIPPRKLDPFFSYRQYARHSSPTSLPCGIPP